jgi:hypothetical protein
MKTYIVNCYIPGQSIDTTIEAREMTVKDGAYQFWKGKYGQTNELIASYPVAFTVVNAVEKEETSDKGRKIPSVPKEDSVKLSEGVLTWKNKKYT